MQPGMRTKMPALSRIFLPVAVGAGCMITFLCVINGVAATANTAPRSGDIISFQGTQADRATTDARILVRRAAGGAGCTLDLGLLRQTGGSFVIESEASQAIDAFKVHWAGKHTAAADDCGDSASLIVTAHDLDQLALSAGGYGVSEKRLPGSMNVFGK